MATFAGERAGYVRFAAKGSGESRIEIIDIEVVHEYRGLEARVQLEGMWLLEELVAHYPKSKGHVVECSRSPSKSPKGVSLLMRARDAGLICCPEERLVIG